MKIVAQSSTHHPLQLHNLLSHLHSSFSFAPKLPFQPCNLPSSSARTNHKLSVAVSQKPQICQREMREEVEPFARALQTSVLLAPRDIEVMRRWMDKLAEIVLCFSFGGSCLIELFVGCVDQYDINGYSESPSIVEQISLKKPLLWISTLSLGASSWLSYAQEAEARDIIRANAIYETGELFELGIQLSYLLLLLALLGAGSFFVIRQVLVRRELDLSAKELQEQVRSGDASATELFELGAVMLRRKFYPAANKYLLQAIDKWDGDDQDLAQVYNALGVSYVRDGKTDKGIASFETAVKLQPGYVTAWNNLGDAYEQKKDLNSALKAFEEVLLFDPNNKVARPRRDALKEKVTMYKGVPVKSKKR